MVERIIPLEHDLLPAKVQAQLKAAAGIDPDLRPGESLFRRKALEQVTENAKLNYPNYFKKEK